MKTVGIITAHCSMNPGASLQAYALCKKISDLNCNPIIIDYRPLNFVDFVERSEIGAPLTKKERLKKLIVGKRLRMRYHLFQQFESEYYPEKTECYRNSLQINASPPILDAYLCGSDQIWNPKHILYDDTYFLSFAKKFPGVRFSYAASVGQDKIDEKEIDFLKNSIKNIDFISVREDTAVSLLHEEIGIEREIRQHIDPTLLYPAEYWRSIENAPATELPTQYILYYPLQDNPIANELIKEVKKQTGLPCIAVCSSLKKPFFVDKQISIYGPKEFLYLIDNAETILTNSYHGIIFSLLFGKNLVPYRNLVRNSRIESLFRILKLENMQVDSMNIFKQRNWADIWERAENIENILDFERFRSTEYLKEILI